jgi:hypothetical protein
MGAWRGLIYGIAPRCACAASALLPTGDSSHAAMLHRPAAALPVQRAMT